MIMQTYRSILAAVVLVTLAAATPLRAQAVRVELKHDGNGNWQLLRGGEPYFILGAGGDHSKELLKQLGGNSFRTWGVGNDTQAKLDEAHRLGLTVTLGIWLGHERHGFNYNDPDQVARQLEQARQAVLKYKDHPALLMWGVGNEMEGEGSNAAIWTAVNQVAAMIKQLDPDHPTMTVIAELGGRKVSNLHRLCPDIDVVGINTYAGGRSVAQRYREAGGTKPFVITEFGPAGMWEVGKNAWGAPAEPTSTEKARWYRATYDGSILPEKEKLCLGSYAFTWGHKQEATATWFGLFLPDGARVEAVDTLAELWTGKVPENRTPQIASLKAVTSDRVAPGETVRVRVEASDPEKDPLRIVWKLTRDHAQYNTGGDHQAAPPAFPDAIVNQGEPEVELKMPAEGGGYWLYAVVYDDHGGAATATLPLFVAAPETGPKAEKAKLPMPIYADGKSSPYAPSGWMGNTGAVAMDENHTGNPHSGETCLRVSYSAPDQWAGVTWQHPANDWGDAAGGFDLSGAKRVSFWARGETGEEKVEFKLGILGQDKKFPDSASAESGTITLTRDWKQYSIDLAGKDLGRIKTPFVWVLAGQGKPVTFYLDDIQYE